VRDEKMREKLTTHDIQDVLELFTLAIKCARATKGYGWHSTLALRVGKDNKPSAGATTQGGNNNKNKKMKKADSNNQPLAGASIAGAVAAGGGRGPRGDKRPHQAFGSDDGGARCTTP
jgi:hypothetical protein